MEMEITNLFAGQSVLTGCCKAKGGVVIQIKGITDVCASSSETLLHTAELNK